MQTAAAGNRQHSPGGMSLATQADSNATRPAGQPAASTAQAAADGAHDLTSQQAQSASGRPVRASAVRARATIHAAARYEQTSGIRHLLGPAARCKPAVPKAKGPSLVRKHQPASVDWSTEEGPGAVAQLQAGDAPAKKPKLGQHRLSAMSPLTVA